MPQVANNQLTYTLVNGVQYIDVFRDLSALNRKLIPQGRVAFITDVNYQVIAASTAGGWLSMSGLPNNWVTHNAWVKAEGHWSRQQRDARIAAGATSVKPKWEDFKIYFDAAHRTGTTLAVPGLSYGEWIHSKLVYSTDADGALREPFMHMMGNDVSTSDVGLILAYQNSRATVDSDQPNVPDEASTNIYAILGTNTDEVSDDVIQNQESENDDPPYDIDDYPGNDSNATHGHQVNLVASGVTTSSQTSVSGILAPCGLLKINHQGIDPSDGSLVTAPTGYLQFRVAFGKFKGLAAPSMGQ